MPAHCSSVKSVVQRGVYGAESPHSQTQNQIHDVIKEADPLQAQLDISEKTNEQLRSLLEKYKVQHEELAQCIEQQEEELERLKGKLHTDVVVKEFVQESIALKHHLSDCVSEIARLKLQINNQEVPPVPIPDTPDVKSPTIVWACDRCQAHASVVQHDLDDSVNRQYVVLQQLEAMTDQMKRLKEDCNFWRNRAEQLQGDVQKMERQKQDEVHIPEVEKGPSLKERLAHARRVAGFGDTLLHLSQSEDATQCYSLSWELVATLKDKERPSVAAAKAARCAEVLLRVGQCEEAAQAYVLALELAGVKQNSSGNRDKDHARKAALCGDCLVRVGQLEEAVNSYTLAIDLGSLKPCVGNRAYVYLQLGKADLCLNDCNIFMQMPGPTDAEIYLYRARSLIALERHAEAAVDLRTGLQLKPNSSEMQQLLEHTRSILSPNVALLPEPIDDTIDKKTEDSTPRAAQHGALPSVQPINVRQSLSYTPSTSSFTIVPGSSLASSVLSPSTPYSNAPPVSSTSAFTPTTYTRTNSVSHPRAFEANRSEDTEKERRRNPSRSVREDPKAPAKRAPSIGTDNARRTRSPIPKVKKTETPRVASRSPHNVTLSRRPRRSSAVSSTSIGQPLVSPKHPMGIGASPFRGLDGYAKPTEFTTPCYR